MSVPRHLLPEIPPHGEDGTHSILDIEIISHTPSFGTLVLLADNDYYELFGTLMPTHEQVLAKGEELQSRHGRWSGSCVVVYEHSEPTQIFLTGYSGD